MKALQPGVLMLSTICCLGVVGVERGWCSWLVGVTHCWALRHQAQMSPDGFVMAGWFLGVCHVDSGREHQPAQLAA